MKKESLSELSLAYNAALKVTVQAFTELLPL